MTGVRSGLGCGDETWAKLPYNALHHVDELLILDPDGHTVRWLSLGTGGDYHDVNGSRLIDRTTAQLPAQLGCAM